METIVCIAETIIGAPEAITAIPEAIISIRERIDSLMAVIADRVKTHPSHASTIADDVERIDNEAELIVTNPTTISSKGETGGKQAGKPGVFDDIRGAEPLSLKPATEIGDKPNPVTGSS